MAYRPQSPDLSSYAPRSPDLSAVPTTSAYRPQSPDLSGLGVSSHQGGLEPQYNSYYSSAPRLNSESYLGGAQSIQPTSQPTGHTHPHYGYDYVGYDSMAPRRGIKAEDDDYMPDAPARRSARNNLPQQQYSTAMTTNGTSFPDNQQLASPQPMVKEENPDPTLGVTLKTSFPVARIKRIMQADEDIGKVAQVTPHVVSRALELFMIKLISAAADEARGGPAGAGKGPKRVLAQHMKKAVTAEPKFDFLADIMGKVPDAPTGKAPSGKAKKGSGSDSEVEEKKPRKRTKKRKDSGDDL